MAGRNGSKKVGGFKSPTTGRAKGYKMYGGTKSTKLTSSRTRRKKSGF